MRVDRLAPADRLMLAMDRTWPQDVGALGILEGDRLMDANGECRVDLVRQAVAARLHLVPRFRKRVIFPRRPLGGPYWADCPRVDLQRHVQVMPLAPGAGEAELLAATERLRRQRLDPSLPLWEIWLLPGLANRRVGLFLRMHHAVGDGRAAMSLLGTFLDRAPETELGTPVPWPSPPPPRDRALLVDRLARLPRGILGMATALVHAPRTLRGVRDALPALRELLAEKPGSKTSLERLVGLDRRLAVVPARTLALRRVARAHGATENDVLVAVIAGGLRALLAARGEPVGALTLRLYVPVSLRGVVHGPTDGNEISQMVVPVGMAEADPARRLVAVAAETRRRKLRHRPSLGSLFRLGPLTQLVLMLIVRQHVNVTTASIPASRRPLYLAGARLLELYPLLNLLGNQVLGIGSISYAGQSDITILADRDSFPDLEVLVAGMRADLDRLTVQGDWVAGETAAAAGTGRSGPHAGAVAVGG